MRIVRVIFGILFGLFFAGAGTAILFQTSIPTYQAWQQMQHWQPASADLLQVEGAENYTKATYRYSVLGVTYENSRVYVADFNDNIGSYHQQLARKLQQHQGNKQSIAIWINPAYPQQSVIDRDMRWGLFALMSAFCSVFIMVGLLVVYAFIKGANKTRAKISTYDLKQQWENKKKDSNYSESFMEFRRMKLHEINRQQKTAKSQQWKMRKGWKTKRIRSEAKAGLLIFWAFTLFWNAISSPIIFVFQDEWQKGNHAIVIGLLFPLVGAVMLLVSCKKTLEYFRFGVVTFDMDPYPGAIGGHVGGVVSVNKWLDDTVLNTVVFKLSLECIHSYVSGSGKNRSQHETIKWAEDGIVKGERSPKGFRLPFYFDVPVDLPEAEVEQSGSYIFWRLRVGGKLPGVDLNRSFNIPVMKTGESSRYRRNDLSAQYREAQFANALQDQQLMQRGEFHLTGLGKGIHIRQTDQVLSLHFPMFRQKVLTIFALVFAGGFGFASYSVLTEFSFNRWASIFSGLFAIPFVLVALVASLASIWLLLGNFSTRITRDTISVVHRLLIFPIRRHRISLGEIDYLSIKQTGSTGQGVKKVEHFKVIAHPKSGKPFTLASDIDGEALAKQFKEYLETYLKKVDKVIL